MLLARNFNGGLSVVWGQLLDLRRPVNETRRAPNFQLYMGGIVDSVSEKLTGESDSLRTTLINKFLRKIGVAANARNRCLPTS